MKTKIYTLLLIGLSLCSCEKTIDIDFHSVVPLYYVEGWITPYETIVRVSQTQIEITICQMNVERWARPIVWMSR